MPSTHLSLHYHLVFSTKDRRPLIVAAYRERLHGYLGGVVRTAGGTPLAIGGTDDHVHLLVGLRATHRLAAVLRDLKSLCSGWMRDQYGAGSFAWQEGYGAFTVSPGDIPRVRAYIAHQEEHHRTTSFQDEYVALLQEFGVEFDARYLW